MTTQRWPKGRLVAHPEPGKVWVQVQHRDDIGRDWIEVEDRADTVTAAVLALADDWDDFEHDLATCPKYDCGDCTMKNAVYDLRTCVESVTGIAATPLEAEDRQ